MLLIVTAVLVWAGVSLVVGLGLGGLVWRSRRPVRRPELVGAADSFSAAGQPQARAPQVPRPRASQDQPSLDGTYP
jgi:hypothetical protein